MNFESVMRKSTFSALFLIIFLASSCSPQCNQWKVAVIKANCPCTSYVKVYLPSCNTFNGLETVLVSSNGIMRLYFYAVTLLFPLFENDERFCEVILSVDGENYSFISDRLQGGQCLLLPDDARQLLIESLLENKCVEVTTGRYQTTLTDENFCNAYKNLY